MGINCKFNSSFFSRNGILIPAFPIKTFGCFLSPEIIYAVSGDALTYPVNTITKIRAPTKTLVITPVFIKKSNIIYLLSFYSIVSFLFVKLSYFMSSPQKKNADRCILFLYALSFICTCPFFMSLLYHLFVIFTIIFYIYL